MLLRSSSTPILNSWIPTTQTSSHHHHHHHHHHNYPPDPDPTQKPKPVTLSTTTPTSPFSSPSLSSASSSSSSRRMTRALSETDLRDARKQRLPPPMSEFFLNGVVFEEEVEVMSKPVSIFDVGCWGGSDGCGGGGSDGLATVLVGGGVSGGGGKICGRGGGSGGGDGGGGGGGGGGDEGHFSDSNGNGNDGTDVYYQKMIEANPNNSLLLSNYAKYLKDVRFSGFEKFRSLGSFTLCNLGLWLYVARVKVEQFVLKKIQSLALSGSVHGEFGL